MGEEPILDNSISLGGRTWAVPPLPWRVVRSIQPRLGAFFTATRGEGARVLVLSTADLDSMAQAIFEAVSFAAPGLTREEFDGLSFGSLDLARAIPAVSRAAGMIKDDGGAEASPDAGKGSAGPT